MYMCIMMLYLYVISWEQLERGNLVFRVLHLNGRDSLLR